MLESSDKTWATGKGNGKLLQYSCLENPMNSMKRQNDMILKYELPKFKGVHYATGEERRNNSGKNEEGGPKRKWYSVVDLFGSESKVWPCKERYCIGTWNVRSMNQGKLVKQGDGKSKHQHFRNQWTKVDGNGQISFRWPLYILPWARIP